MDGANQSFFLVLGSLYFREELFSLYNKTKVGALT